MITQEEINALRHKVIAPQKMLIDGQWVDASDGGTVDVVSPIDGKKLTTLAAATVEDVDRAVLAARKVFERGDWSRMAPQGRMKIMHKIADLIADNAKEMAVLGARDNGTEIGMAIKAEPGSAAGTFRFYAEAIDKVYGEIAPTADNQLALIHREPVGVVGAIVPWNFPMMIGAWKIAPALAAGNSVVLKPSEAASLNLLRLAEICQEAGLPDGVLNVITGSGSMAGEAMGLHHDIDIIGFTGSGGVGRRLMDYAARSNMKRLYLELGGKSPNIIFADAADLDHAAKVSAAGIFRNSGEVCVAGSRILVERTIHDAFVEKLRAETAKYKVGDPLDLGNNIGAITTAQQLEGDLAFVERAQKEGGTLVTGGKQLNAGQGYYMEPTIFTDIKPNMDLFQNEVFGPVVSVTPFDTEEEAVALANGTDFGLAAGVWTSNLSRAHRMVRNIKSGVVHVNTYGGAGNNVPLAGMKQSGNGADKSLHAIEKYENLKTAWIQL
ncbi:gamma-glutamyl-gamma-aminobutyraldehyde dehydrogenase [Maritalea mobilis]|uniref:Gamma-glutamyl-gamma-aminobutyraldehyde dehydrogenase n=1 Tax=Maritalea mobilis TaxID=483324 RepID=A0A4R6VT10_9HYPH|nr:aldehyde dehydrogenase family protein [Maritalea mobilis]TDQ67213.1 gamma-glutamyl-gamma-aminobutyraldehyde dehydrogenase [Maritalea mobilis]